MPLKTVTELFHPPPFNFMPLISMLLMKGMFTTRHLTWTDLASCWEMQLQNIWYEWSFLHEKVLCQKWRQLSAFALLKYWMLDINNWTGNIITGLLIRCIFFNLGKKKKKAKWNMKVHWEKLLIKTIKRGCGILNSYTCLKRWLTRLNSPGSGCTGQFFICLLRSNVSISFMRHN